MQRKTALLAGAAILGLAVLAGCESYGPHRHYGPPPSGVVYISRTPPPPRTVIIPPRPTALSVWIGGYWDWNGVDFVWVDGRWDRNPPRPGAQWIPSQWVHSNQGWYRHPGRWK